MRLVHAVTGLIIGLGIGFFTGWGLLLLMGIGYPIELMVKCWSENKSPFDILEEEKK